MFDALAQQIPYHTLIDTAAVRLDVKRLDLIHPQISGNKFYKLKYNLIEAQKRGCARILTFGGAFSILPPQPTLRIALIFRVSASYGGKSLLIVHLILR